MAALVWSEARNGLILLGGDNLSVAVVVGIKTSDFKLRLLKRRAIHLLICQLVRSRLLCLEVGFHFSGARGHVGISGCPSVFGFARVCLGEVCRGDLSPSDVSLPCFAA